MSKNISIQSLLKYSKSKINQIDHAFGTNGNEIILNTLDLCFALLVCLCIYNFMIFAAMRDLQGSSNCENSQNSRSSMF